jgi:glucokinase
MTQAGTEAPLATVKAFFTGIDVGGTKIDIADTLGSRIHRLQTADYPSLEGALDFYFHTEQVIPKTIVVGMAGPRDDETGVVALTNNDETNWPAFDPRAASERYGTRIVTKNDMEIAAAGVLQETAEDWQQIKPGKAAETGTKLVATHSTGVGTSAAVWDSRSERFVIMPAEGGHISWQPKNEWEQGYFRRLNILYPHVSAEFALGGEYGIDTLVDYALEEPDETAKEATALRNAVGEARLDKYPTGAVLMDFATEGEGGASQETAEEILRHFGAMTGSVLRDLTVATKATGGVYMTGTVALETYGYLAETTEFNQRFVRAGAPHDEWLERVPISLIIDPHAAAVGALALAKEL